MGRSSSSLGPVMVAAALITVAAGAVLYLAVDETVGLVVGAIGLIDLLTLPFVLRVVRRGSGPAGAPAREDPAEGAQPNPGYNPYARED